MAMKKIKPQYGKVIPPAVNSEEESAGLENDKSKVEMPPETDKTTQTRTKKKSAQKKEKLPEVESAEQNESVSRITADPNPFMQTKEVFNQANLTKIGYRMRTEYVEILDIIKKLKKGGYTLEAVLDDALTYYFENSEDGKEALKKAEIFYS